MNICTTRLVVLVSVWSRSFQICYYWTEHINTLFNFVVVAVVEVPKRLWCYFADNKLTTVLLLWQFADCCLAIVYPVALSHFTVCSHFPDIRLSPFYFMTFTTSCQYKASKRTQTRVGFCTSFRVDFTLSAFWHCSSILLCSFWVINQFDVSALAVNYLCYSI